jgi:hypothetical protein
MKLHFRDNASPKFVETCQRLAEFEEGVPPVEMVSAHSIRVVNNPTWDGWEMARNQEGKKHDRVIEIIGVSSGVKRDGCIVDIDGIDTTGLRKNNVFLWGHQYDKPPIGRIVATMKADHETLGRVMLIRVARLNTRNGGGEWSKFANEMMDFIEDGNMHAVSFGWGATKWSFIRDGENDYVTGIRYEESDAYEFSLVTVPADMDAVTVDNGRSALQAAIQRGKISQQFVGHLVAKPSRALHTIRDFTDPPKRETPPAEDKPNDDLATLRSEISGWRSEVATRLDAIEARLKEPDAERKCKGCDDPTCKDHPERSEDDIERRRLVPSRISWARWNRTTSGPATLC